MTGFQALYGLDKDQIVIPIYQDCFTISEAARAWRQSVRDVIRDIRVLNIRIGRSRDLNERYVLNIELKNRHKHMAAALEAYRTANRASHMMAKAFVGGLVS